MEISPKTNTIESKIKGKKCGEGIENFQFLEVIYERRGTQVSKAKLKATGKTYVIKRLSKGHLERKCQLHIVLNEKILLNYLDHSQIVKLHKTF